MSFIRHSNVLFLVFTVACGASAAELSMLPWFNQDYSGFNATSWKDDKGTWVKTVYDLSSFNQAENKINLDTHGSELAFSPETPSNASCPASVDVRMMFASPMKADSQEIADDDAQALLALREQANGYVFTGWTASGWKNLAAPGLAPTTNTLYDVRVEMDYAHSPVRVRYSVGGTPLTDANGTAWFNSAAGAKRQIASVCFTGNGEVGTFAGEHEPPSAFSIDHRASAPGEPVNLSITTNATPRGAVTYSWQAGGRNKSWNATPFSTAARPVLDASLCENWVRVVMRDDDGVLGEKEFFFSRLPVCFITTDDGATPSSRKEEHAGKLRIQGNSRYADQYDGPITIKVRGNSTAGLAKKPWKIKLDKKTDLFGFGKSKHWVLLANYLDVGLMRNTIAYDLSGELGLVHTKTTWVDVFLNGAYQGNYQLCEHIRVDEGRVNVYNWEDAAESVAGKFASAHDLTDDQEDSLITQLQENFSWVTSDSVTFNGITDQPSKLWKKFTNDISGGYLFELSHEYDELSKFTIAESGLSLKVMLNAPEYLYSNPTMMGICSDLWTDLVRAWTTPDGRTPDGRAAVDLADMDSMAAYLLALEIPGNNDAVYKSRYAWKEQGQPLVFGPAWDYDWGCGSPVVGGTNTTCSGWRVATSGNEAAFFREWVDDPYFCLLLWEKYHAVRSYLTELLRDGGLYDQSRAYIYESGMADSQKWFNAGDNRKGYTFDVDSAWFKTYLTRRVAWLDEKFANVQTLMASLKTSNSRNPYSRCPDGKIAPTFPRGHRNSSSAETEALDVRVPLGATVAVDVTLTSTGTKTIAAVVNGHVIDTQTVVNGACAFELPATAFREEGRRNMIDFIGYRGDNGAVQYRTWAIVTRTGGTRIILR